MLGFVSDAADFTQINDKCQENPDHDRKSASLLSFTGARLMSHNISAVFAERSKQC
jgi:hypothetical protein